MCPQNHEELSMWKAMSTSSAKATEKKAISIKKQRSVVGTLSTPE